MESFVLARVIHVLGVVLWIGGVAMVTMSILPAVRKIEPKEEQFLLFERIESRFARHAQVLTLLTGLSGFYMLYYLDAWSRYTQLRFWWIHAMTLIWVIFSLVLFVFEPLFLHRLVREKAARDPVRTLATVHRMHWLLLLLSLITTAGATAGSHGWYWF
jgi:uncharacterized membrane protein